jgi:hypothetical protein
MIFPAVLRRVWQHSRSSRSDATFAPRRKNPPKKFLGKKHALVAQTCVRSTPAQSAADSRLPGGIFGAEPSGAGARASSAGPSTPQESVQRAVILPLRRTRPALDAGASSPSRARLRREHGPPARDDGHDKMNGRSLQKGPLGPAPAFCPWQTPVGIPDDTPHAWMGPRREPEAHAPLGCGSAALGSFGDPLTMNPTRKRVESPGHWSAEP